MAKKSKAAAGGVSSKKEGAAAIAKASNKSQTQSATQSTPKSANRAANLSPVGARKKLAAPRVPTATGGGDSANKLYGEIAIEEAQLERFENRTQVRRYQIDFTCPEFTCVCPRSGFPDFATIRIRYVPRKYCVELKSLKLYINSFRNEKVFHEDVTNIIIQDLIDLLDPWEVDVVGDFTVRGNIHTVVTAKHVRDDA